MSESNNPVSESAEVADAVEETAHGDHHEEVGVEPESINSFLILGVIGATAMVVIILIVIGFTITTSYSQKNEEQMVAETSYPEIREVRAAAMAELNRSGVVDAGAGIYRIPVDQAMNLMVEMQYKNPGGEFSEEVQLTPPQ